MRGGIILARPIPTYVWETYKNYSIERGERIWQRQHKGLHSINTYGHVYATGRTYVMSVIPDEYPVYYINCSEDIVHKNVGVLQRLSGIFDYPFKE